MSSNQLSLSISPNGIIFAIYKDDLAPLVGMGDSEIKRASFVEPSHDLGVPLWDADMFPVSGPVLGPFLTRGDALEAEEKWLKQNLDL